MFNIRSSTDSKARSFKPAHAKLHSIDGHNFDRLPTQVVNEPGDAKHPLGNLCHELRFACENDNRFDGAGRQEFEQILHRSNVPEILKYWILKSELPLENDLSPVRLTRVGEYPSFVVLDLDDENTEPRNENVINLSCTVVHLKGNVIHQMIVRRTEVRQRDAGQQRLATILERGGTRGTAATNDEANGKSEEDIDSGLFVQLPIKEKLRQALNHRAI
ncbi:hypothetical protein QT386_07160 [Solimonas sp. SE-A11]|nr:hypothetical protein [Solimonas sp. SE-A11]MDM4769970.1 hypothetical protein [Solimonas sp. SE-A11]